jgi:hypothetical protein
MNDVGEARQWDEVVRHLIQAHGAEPGRLTGFVFTLGEVRFAHLDTHAALAIISQRPPDGHTHPAPENPGLLSPLSSAYMPFPGSPSVREHGAYQHASRLFRAPERFHPIPEFTGLPQTGVHPSTEADLADWPSAAMRILLEIYSDYGIPDAAEAVPRIREVIERTAAGPPLTTGKPSPGFPRRRTSSSQRIAVRGERLRTRGALPMFAAPPAWPQNRSPRTCKPAFHALAVTRRPGERPVLLSTSRTHPCRRDRASCGPRCSSTRAAGFTPGNGAVSMSCCRREGEPREVPATDQAVRTACTNQLAGAGQATAPAGQGPRP